MAWPDAPPHVLAAVANAIEYAEQAAANAAALKHEAQYHARAADEAANLTDETSQAVAESGAYFPAHAAANAAAAVAYPEEAVAFAYYAASDASTTISQISGGTTEAILADLERVEALARSQNWTDETAVPPNVFTDGGGTSDPNAGS